MFEDAHDKLDKIEDKLEDFVFPVDLDPNEFNQKEQEYLRSVYKVAQLKAKYRGMDKELDVKKDAETSKLYSDQDDDSRVADKKAGAQEDFYDENPDFVDTKKELANLLARIDSISEALDQAGYAIGRWVKLKEFSRV